MLALYMYCIISNGCKGAAFGPSTIFTCCSTRAWIKCFKPYLILLYFLNPHNIILCVLLVYSVYALVISIVYNWRYGDITFQLHLKNNAGYIWYQTTLFWTYHRWTVHVNWTIFVNSGRSFYHVGLNRYFQSWSLV